jgi:tripartite-type tricarboxylate transporter receptor subunit TctC
MYPDMIAETWFAVYAPPQTPADLREKISGAIAEALKDSDVQMRLKEMGDIEAVGSTPAEMAAFIQREKARWAAVIKDAQIKGE